MDISKPAHKSPPYFTQLIADASYSSRVTLGDGQVRAVHQLHGRDTTSTASGTTSTASDATTAVSTVDTSSTTTSAFSATKDSTSTITASTTTTATSATTSTSTSSLTSSTGVSTTSFTATSTVSVSKTTVSTTSSSSGTTSSTNAELAAWNHAGEIRAIVIFSLLSAVALGTTLYIFIKKRVNSKKERASRLSSAGSSHSTIPLTTLRKEDSKTIRESIMFSQGV
ncbi:hypothetical protein BGW36DRAFT_429465 [Talaromyces proteolyticus]|uniref:Uncharacterized protein n=1 Tax=Talaromyces proteolyticus TaxID=1131652 RepID=A0AAD4PYV9_9EURO|nr:uncharacterized protein BGW36DRAFT_429465 [Talaromyces proteolyticus]KAH8695593.1 hypothetical protein BGW36DRAFT_429465 [Talaromyces proteolyticus]